MERGIYGHLRRTLRSLGRRRASGRHRYTDAGILEVYLWAALHDRPVSWACVDANWPPGTRRGPIPDASTISRRMRTPAVAALLERLRRRLERPLGSSLVAIVDGKPLPIGPHSHDRQAGFGRAAGGKAKGYKLHAVIEATGRVLAWRVAPMNKDERPMARRMLRQLEHTGYLLADANYDTNTLHRVAGERGIQLLAPRYASRRGRPLGHHAHSDHRRRSIEMLERSPSPFGRELLRRRVDIERFFGTLVSTPGGLAPLPAWVRTWRRVRNWVAAKLAILAARRQIRPQ